MSHATSHNVATHLASDHLSISEITLHCSLPRHHHFTSPHLKSHVPHHAATVHISRDSTSTTIPHHTHIRQHRIFHTTPYSTSHTTSDILILHHTTTSDITTRCIVLHIWRHITAHCIYATFFITTILHHHISHSIVTFHILHYATFHIPGHHTEMQNVWCGIWRGVECRTMSEMATFHIAPHFTSHRNSHQITPPHLHTIPHHVHITPRHAHHHIQI